MCLKRKRVEHLNHQCELNAPVIINIVVIVIVTTTVHHTWQEYWSPHPRRRGWRQAKCSRCDEPRSASWSTVSGKLPCCAPGDNNVFDWQARQGASSEVISDKLIWKTWIMMTTVSFETSPNLPKFLTTWEKYSLSLIQGWRKVQRIDYDFALSGT